MNFYKFYNILNENTVSQELKKIKTIQDVFDEFDSGSYSEIDTDSWLKYAQDGIKVHLPNISENSLRAFAKWIVYRKSTKTLRITGSRPEIGLISLLVYGHRDFLTSALDDNGNFNPQLISKFNNPQFKYTDFNQLDNEYHTNLSKGNIRMPGRFGKTILKFNDGYEWVNLERGFCDIESKSMGHCGNEGAKKGDTILSLRDDKNIPYLTFILNNGDLTQMKGRGPQGGNSKPHPKYHKYIIELLKLPIIKRVVGGGYMPETNFNISDLSEDQINELLKAKPELEDSYYLGVIKEKTLPDRVYERLLSFGHKTFDANFIYDIAVSAYTPKEILDKLWNLLIHSKNPGFFEDDHWTVVIQIGMEGFAGNSNSSSEILKKIYKINNPITSRLLAKNPNTPQEILNKLSELYPGEVVSNPSSPKELAEKLFNSTNDATKWRMAETATDTKLLEKLSDDPSRKVRYNLTNNKNITPEILTKMSKDEAPSIRMHVAYHPKCPIEVLRVLENDSDGQVSDAAKWRLSNRIDN
jgi:hypothetical protein